MFGAGDYATHFTTWGPTPDGPMLLLTSSKTIATMSWAVHGMHFDGCSVDYAFAVNAETPVSKPGPRAEHNNFKLSDVTFVRGVGLVELPCCAPIDQFWFRVTDCVARNSEIITSSSPSPRPHHHLVLTITIVLPDSTITSRTTRAMATTSRLCRDRPARQPRARCTSRTSGPPSYVIEAGISLHHLDMAVLYLI